MAQLGVISSHPPAASQGIAPALHYQHAAPLSTKRQQDYINEDVLRLLHPDCNRPFTNFDDAVDRLLPFHMLGGEETERADYEEAETLSSGGLLLSRHEAWQELCLQKSNQYADELNNLGQKLQDIVKQPLHPRPEEEIYLSKLSTEADKAVSQGIRAEAHRRAAEQLEANRLRDLEADRILREANERLQAEQAQASGSAGPVPEPAAASSLHAQDPGQQQQQHQQQQLQPAAPSLSTTLAPEAAKLQTTAAEGQAPAAPLKQEPEEPADAGGWSGWQ